jgi:hypothetical protein
MKDLLTQLCNELEGDADFDPQLTINWVNHNMHELSELMRHAQSMHKMLSVEIGARVEKVAHVGGFMDRLMREPPRKRAKASDFAATSKAGGSAASSVPGPVKQESYEPVKQEPDSKTDVWLPLDQIDQFKPLVNSIPTEIQADVLNWMICANTVNEHVVKWLPGERLDHTKVEDYKRGVKTVTATTVFFSNMPKTHFECLIGLPIMTIRGQLAVGNCGVVAVNFGREYEDRELCTGQMWVKFASNELAQIAVTKINGWHWSKYRGKKEFIVKAEMSRDPIKTTVNKNLIQSSRYNQDVWSFIPGF